MAKRTLSRRDFLRLAGGTAMAMAAAQFLGACGKPTETTPATTEPSDQPPATEAVVLRSLGQFRDELKNGFHEAYPNITVEDIPITGDKFEKLNTMFATGDPPDLFNTSDVNWCNDRDVAQQQHTILDEFITTDPDFNFEDIYETIRKYMVMPDGHYHFVPQWVNSNVMAYNIDLFDAAGVPYPTKEWTWDDMVDAGIAMTKVDSSGMATQYGKATTFGWWGEYYYYQRQAGLKDWLSEDGQEVFIDSPEAIEGIQFYLDCIFKHQMADKPGECFNGGGYAMWNFIHTGSWPGITEAGVHWDVMVPPKGARPEGGELALDSTAIGKGSKNVDAAWNFLKYSSGKAGGLVWVAIGVPPIRDSVAQETWIPRKGVPEYPVHPEIYFDAMPYNQPVFWAPGSWDAWDSIQKRVDLMLEGKMTVEEGLKEAAQEMRDLIASGGKS